MCNLTITITKFDFPFAKKRTIQEKEVSESVKLEFIKPILVEFV
jgi:hypothetical protein